MTDVEERAQEFCFAFKNGRGDRHKHAKCRTFREVLSGIARNAASCPAFTERSVLIPIPRSGSSRRSFEPGACEWPNLELARVLARDGPHEVAQLLERETVVRLSSDKSLGRVPVAEHIASLRVRVEQRLLPERLVLLDDVLTKGTQAMASFLTLRRAGYTGPIVAFFVHQTVAPRPTKMQRQPFLVHSITWVEGQHFAQRSEISCWRDQPADW